MSEKNAQIEQAIEAVKRQPGSPAYAFLAEHYLEQGQDEEALRICRTGFAANPGFERGAIAFLAALRRKRDLVTAGEVYGRAIAYLPRSARVRVGWAFILADAGKGREARVVAREALDLDPLNREARAFVATLGGTPAPPVPPPGRPPASPTQRLASLAKDAIFDDSDLSEESSSPNAGGLGPRAEVRPWIRPVGQRTTAHKMFDLTPAVAMDPQHRHDLRESEVAIKPISGETATGPQANVVVPTDLFDEPVVKETPPPAILPRITMHGLGPLAEVPTEPSPDTDSSEEEATRLRGPVPTPRMPRVTPLASTPLASTPLARLDTPSGCTTIKRKGGAPPPPPGGLDWALSPTTETNPDEFEEVEGEFQPPQAPPVVPDAASTDAPPLAVKLPASRWRRRVLLAVASAAVLAGAVVGFKYYRNASLKRTLRTSLESLRVDKPAVYLAVREELARLYSHSAQDPRVGAALALVDANLAVRFSAGEGAERRARDLLARLPTTNRPLAATITQALLDSASGDGTQAVQQLEKAGVIEKSWEALLAAARVALVTGQRNRAMYLYSVGMKLSPPAPAVMEEAAKFYRRSGDLLRAREAVAIGLRASADHPGLRLQEALLAEPSSSLNAAQLEVIAGQTGRLRATAMLIEARQAKQRGQVSLAVSKLAESMRLDPTDPEPAVEAALWQLEPGGSAAQAEALLAKHAAAMARFRPAVMLDLAHALLLLGRPHEARDLLKTIAPADLSERDAQRLGTLEIRAWHWADDDSAVERGCREPVTNPDRNAVCVEALLERARLSHTTALLRSVRDPQALAYLGGLRALTKGNLERAIAQLGRAGAWAFDPVASVLALARAQSRRGNSSEAVKLLRDIVPRDSRSARSRVALAMALTSGGHDTEAQAQLESLLADRPTQPSLLGQAGEAFLAMGLPTKAETLVEQGIAQAPGSLLIQMLAGRVAAASRHPDQARQHFNEVLRVSPRHPEALIELGRLEEAAGQSAQARRRFALALKQRPQDPDLLFLVARAQARSGDPKAAVSAGLKAIQMVKASGQETRSYDMMMELGKLLATGDKWARSRAEELFFEAAKPKNAGAPPFLEMGRLHRSNGDLKRAVWCFRQAVERDPNLADAWLELGKTLRAKPQWRKEAKTALRHFLKLRPDDKEAAKVRAMLDKLR